VTLEDVFDDVIEEHCGLLSKSEKVDPALLVLDQPPVMCFCQEVGGGTNILVTLSCFCSLNDRGHTHPMSMS